MRQPTDSTKTLTIRRTPVSIWQTSFSVVFYILLENKFDIFKLL